MDEKIKERLGNLQVHNFICGSSSVEILYCSGALSDDEWIWSIKEGWICRDGEFSQTRSVFKGDAAYFDSVLLPGINDVRRCSRPSRDTSD